MSISDPLFDLGSLWYDPEPLEFPKLVPYNKSRSSNPNKVNIRNLLVFSCKLSIQYTECFILQCAFQLALIDRNIPVRLSYSWVPNKRVYLIIGTFSTLLDQQIFHPTDLLYTIFWNSTNSKPTRLIFSAFSPTLLVYLALLV